MHQMLKEIQEIPAVLAAVLKIPQGISDLVKAIKQTKPKIVYIAGRGSSYHAALAGKYLFEAFLHIPVCILAPSVFIRYNGTLPFENNLTIVISQSGYSQELEDLLILANKNNGLTVSITNNSASALAKLASYPLPIMAGPEKAVPATKSYAASLTMLFVLLQELAGNLNWDWELLISEIEKILTKEDEYIHIASSLCKMTHGFVLGRGVNFPTALEVALKLQECAGVLAAGMGVVDFFHGPVAAVKESLPVLFISPVKEDKAAQMLVEKVKSQGGMFVPLPKTTILEELSPIVYAVEGQLLAYYLALAKNQNPDTPSGLSKVTRV